jgi:hypothetical protein
MIKNVDALLGLIGGRPEPHDPGYSGLLTHLANLRPPA